MRRIFRSIWHEHSNIKRFILRYIFDWTNLHFGRKYRCSCNSGGIPGGSYLCIRLGSVYGGAAYHGIPQPFAGAGDQSFAGGLDSARRGIGTWARSVGPITIIRLTSCWHRLPFWRPCGFIVLGAGMRSGLRWKDWLIYTLFLTTATAFKASFVFAFAPSLLILLIVDLVQTRGRNLKREILMGCSVLPSIALCLLQSIVLFGGESEGLQLIFTVDWAEYPGKVLVWGLSNEAARRGAYSLVRVLLALWRSCWGVPHGIISVTDFPSLPSA